jgi:hypothetical protein
LRCGITRRGHLAQIVGHEGLGVCPWKGCAKQCQEVGRLLEHLDRYLAETEPEPARQGGLFEHVEGA